MRLSLLIERLSKSGDGVASHQGRAVFVAGVAVGETVEVELVEGGKALRGELVRVEKASPARREPPCPLADRCGGCSWLHLEEAEQRKQKEEIVLGSLEHVAGLERESLERSPIVSASAALGVRRRATLHPQDGKLGFFGRRSHEHVAVERCPALTPRLTSLPGALAEALGSHLKGIEEVRLLEAGGRVSISLHLEGKVKPKLREAAEALVRGALVDGVVLAGGEGQGAPELVGEPTLRDAGVFVRPDGFAQAGVEVNAALVARAVELLDVRGGEAVLELFSGNGNFTFPLAERAGQVVAVESAALSVQLAQKAAREKKVSTVRFMQGDAEKMVDGLIREAARFDRLLVDPPRTGAPGLERWASRLLVERLVYVACDPVSLARDAKALVGQGYRAEALALFDLFPQTHHVEAVMAFARG